LVAIALLLSAPIARGADIPPPPDRWVNDRVGLLSPATRTVLDRELEDYQRQTGHQIVVWIADTVGDQPLDEFATSTFKAWQIGQKGKDDGLLMVVLARDRKIAIEVGYGLEAQVPDAIASRIIRDVMAPQLRAGNPDGAITDGVHAVLNKIEGKPFEPGRQVTPERGHLSTGQLVFFGVLAAAFLILFLTNPALAIQLLFMIGSGRGRGGDGGFGGGGFGGGGGFQGGGGRSGGGGARGSW
jgi:uncharacterized protein